MTVPLLRRWLPAALVAVMAGTATTAAQAGPVLDGIRERQQVRCGVSSGLAGFSQRTAEGTWVGFDVDYCRATAAAVLGDARRVTFVPMPVQQGLQALAAGDIDVLSRTVTITLKRVAALGLHPVGVNFFDGQGFLVRRSSGLRTLHQLNGRALCFQSGTTAEETLRDAFSARHLTYTPVGKAGFQEMIAAFVEGGCDAVTADSSTLASIRVSALPHPEDFVLLRQRLSKEPLGPLIRKGDDAWLEITRWTLMAMIEAEELGVTRRTVDAMRQSDNPRVLRLLGVTPGLGAALGLDEGWAVRIIAQVGNYGESFAATVGADSPLKLDRGLNELWTRGGLMFAFPLR
jgi:general L-amino acid transport system substrate-binding protein